MSHLIAIVADDLQNVIGFSRCLSGEVNFPRILGLSVHDVSSDEPFDVAFLAFIFLVSDRQETSFSLFVIAY